MPSICKSFSLEEFNNLIKKATYTYAVIALKDNRIRIAYNIDQKRKARKPIKTKIKEYYAGQKKCKKSKSDFF